MTFPEMKQLDGELARLERSAFTAGEHLAVWADFAGASYEALSKCVGRGAMVEQLQDGRSFELALAGLFAAFCRGRRRSQLVAELVEIDGQSDPTRILNPSFYPQNTRENKHFTNSPGVVAGSSQP